MKIFELIEAVEQAKTDEKDNVLSRIQRTVYGTESGYGKADTSKPNYAGALGPMQILPGTFDWMKKSGVIPKDYDINDPVQNKAAGDALLAHYYKKYGGDDAKVYAAYYGGPGAVNRDGSINTHWRDLKNPKAPTIGQYIEIARAKANKADRGSSSGDVNRSAPSSTMASADSSNNAPVSDRITSTLSDIGTSLSGYYDRIASNFSSSKATDNDSAEDNRSDEEVILIIAGKRMKFRNRKEAQAAIQLAMASGQEVQIG